MHPPLRLYSAPSNLCEFVDEILPTFQQLYGPLAGRHYASNAIAGLSAAISSPEILAFGTLDGTKASALLFARRDGSRLVITFFHLLVPDCSRELATALLQFALAEWKDGVEEVFTEFVPFGRLHHHEVFSQFAFQRLDRQLMRRKCLPPTQSLVDDFETRVFQGDDVAAFAEVLTDTYADHPERFLFPEVQSLDAACDFLARVRSGSLGLHRPDYLIGGWRGGLCAGFALGCEVLPGLGFVVHLAVRPQFQGLGLGTALLEGLNSTFAAQGLDYTALGVTCDNPAVRLYERSGFAAITHVPVYFRRETIELPHRTPGWPK